MTDISFEVLPITKREITLKGQEAIDLWLSGKDSWNAWVEEHPVANVDFRGMDFSYYHRKSLSPSVGISFANFRFPNGLISFTGAQFGEVGAIFTGAQFGEGSVCFSKVDFGEGKIDFNSVDFGGGMINFAGARFGKDRVSFNYAKFGTGDVVFNFTVFGEEGVSFYSTDFGEGDVEFQFTDFGEGERSIVFNNAKFGEGNVSFNKAKFRRAVSFIDVTMGKGVYIFERIDFKGRVTFLECNNTKQIKGLSFKYSSFENAFDLSGDFNCIPDITNTKTSHQVSLYGLTCKLQRSEWQSVEPEDAARLRRLKELAENNKDHEMALAFHADEMRAKRWRYTGFWASVLDMAFSGFSNYGQSISRPIFILFFLILSFSGIYSMLATKAHSFLAAFIFSLSNSISFLPISRDARSVGLDILFGAGDSDKPYYLYSLIGLQGILSFVAIFFTWLRIEK